MRRISIRLPAGLDADLTREAAAARSSRSAVIREAITEYLARRETSPFREQIARAAAAPGDDAVAAAEESLPLDNEALELATRG